EELEQTAAQDSADETAEIESLRAELEARKSLIRSLRADAERAQVLESRLEETRHLVQQLEATINRHANTIVELRRASETWKRKYRALKGTDGATTTPSLESLTATDTKTPTIPPIPEAFAGGDGAAVPEQTIAIDMRRALLEARRAAQGGDKSRLLSGRGRLGSERNPGSFRRQVHVADVHALPPADTEAHRRENDVLGAVVRD